MSSAKVKFEILDKIHGLFINENGVDRSEFIRDLNRLIKAAKREARKEIQQEAKEFVKEITMDVLRDKIIINTKEIPCLTPKQ